MKFASAWFSLVILASVSAECPDSVEYTIERATKLSFSGFIPTVNRILNTGVGNKVVFRGFSREPQVDHSGGVISVTAGEPCGEDISVSKTPDENDASDKPETTTTTPEMDLEEGDVATVTSAAKSLFGLSVPLVVGRALGASTLVSTSLTLLTSSLWVANAQNDPTMATTQCKDDPIEVDIYVDTTVKDLVMKEAQSGDYEVCPPETLYWKHHPKVFGGYEGCVGEKSYQPCPQDSQGIWEEEGALYAKYPLNWDGEKCVETGYSDQNRTFWILWGDPLDKYELNKRTGLNPVVSFPFNRGPYPRYEQGVSLDAAVDDSADAQEAAKDFLLYLGAFVEGELDNFDVTFTEGAESGMTHIWAGKALEIARTTCNRDIYALMEVPAYGYSPSDAADIVNKFADSFYNSSECLCFATDTCKEPTVTISNRGWLPTTPFPVELGGDGIAYPADSKSPASPWFESMVFPENPSGVIKVPQLPADRLVCDGVYVWPMYFGMRDYVIPIADRPDCSAWSFSITKGYSASVRAGFIIYDREQPDNHQAMVDAISSSYTMTHGLYSEWSWYGQMQLWDLIMSRPVNDPTSWIGAYSEIMDEKWNLIIDAFENCPVLTLSNPKAGAYAFFVYKEPYLGLQDGFLSTFFRDVLGVRTTTYNWGFRGANPADYYGANHTTEDFTRLQLYRDISVYEEVSRRAKIVCADLDASIGDFLSVNQWVAARSVRRNLKDSQEHRRHLSEAIPDVTERQLSYLVKNQEDSDKINQQANACAPEYTTSCFFKNIGSRFEDF